MIFFCAINSFTPSCRPAHPAKAYERQRGGDVFDTSITIPHPAHILLAIRAARPVDLPDLRNAASLRARAKESTIPERRSLLEENELERGDSECSQELTNR